MSDTVQATFEVSSWDEGPFDEEEGGSKVTRASVGKTYSGAIEGTSATEWLMAYDPDGSASFVGLERIKGAVGGKRGTLVIQHVGRFEDGVAKATLTVLSGTDDLEGASGAGTMTADPAGSVELDLG